MSVLISLFFRVYFRTAFLDSTDNNVSCCNLTVWLGSTSVACEFYMSSRAQALFSLILQFRCAALK